MKFALFLGTLLAFTASIAKADDYIVKLKKPEQFLTPYLQSLGIHAETVSLTHGEYLTFEANPNFNRELLQALSQYTNIEYIEKDVPLYPLEEKNIAAAAADKMWTDQWSLNNTGENNWSKGPKGEDIQAENAWKITQGSSQIIVAVIDSGVQIDHPDLAENIFVNTLEQNGKPGIDDDGNGYIDDIHGWDFFNNDNDPEDDRAHGTHVAGLIGARHNEIGIAGVMSQVRILPLKFIAQNGGRTSDAVKAMDYAVKMGAKIINCSWGGGEFTQALKDAIMAAAQRGVYVVAAAGNSKADNDKTEMYPANYEVPNLVSVGATNGTGKLAAFSNFGAKKVHILAPGAMLVSTIPGGKWDWKSGSSMSAPLVSGALGLLLTLRPDLGSPETIEKGIQLLMNSAYQNPALAGLSRSGRLDLHQLLLRAR
jgi:subtilisin family serine protease